MLDRSEKALLLDFAASAGDRAILTDITPNTVTPKKSPDVDSGKSVGSLLKTNSQQSEAKTAPVLSTVREPVQPTPQTPGARWFVVSYTVHAKKKKVYWEGSLKATQCIKADSPGSSYKLVLHDRKNDVVADGIVTEASIDGGLNEGASMVLGEYELEIEQETSAQSVELSAKLARGELSDIPRTRAEQVGRPLGADNVGYRLLQKMGWTRGGLGADAPRLPDTSTDAQPAATGGDITAATAAAQLPESQAQPLQQQQIPGPPQSSDSAPSRALSDCSAPSNRPLRIGVAEPVQPSFSNYLRGSERAGLGFRGPKGQVRFDKGPWRGGYAGRGRGRGRGQKRKRDYE